MTQASSPAQPSTPQRVALVTGASRGIGRAIALRLARPAAAGGQGRHVVLCARSEGPLKEVESQVRDQGGSASVVAIDIADGAALAGGIEGIVERHGRLDVLVANAGITRDGLLLRMSDEDWHAVLATNLTSAFVAVRAAARAMMRCRFGRIVALSSTSGLVGNAGQANYAASKAGLAGLIKTAARELGSKGITANVVAPGFVQTDMTEHLPEEVKSRVQGMLSVPRLGTPEDIAAAVAYLTSDEAGYITGQVVTVDGGMTMS
ncbi:MAG: 3-oxoacyl-[acyl-carrier-protein] reductase [Planctomyces sp.]|nr:3-oxoacyl-[acyl-carrier-protein] reductase [Planctomyces sp.]